MNKEESIKSPLPISTLIDTNREQVTKTAKEKQSYSDKLDYQQVLGKLYKYIGKDKKKFNIVTCSIYRDIEVFRDGKLRKIPTLTCDDRFCIFCSAVRAYKQGIKYSDKFELIKGTKRFITLTIPNIQIGKDDEIQSFKVFKKLVKKLRLHYKKSGLIVGGLQAYETTYNEKRGQVNLHCHMIVIGKYIKDLGDVWGDITEKQYGIRCVSDIRKCDDNAIKELIKYTVKHSDIIKSMGYFRVVQNMFHNQRALQSFGNLYNVKVDDDEMN